MLVVAGAALRRPAKGPRLISTTGAGALFAGMRAPAWSGVAGCPPPQALGAILTMSIHPDQGFLWIASDHWLRDAGRWLAGAKQGLNPLGVLGVVAERVAGNPAHHRAADLRRRGLEERVGPQQIAVGQAAHRRQHLLVGLAHPRLDLFQRQR